MSEGTFKIVTWNIAGNRGCRKRLGDIVETLTGHGADAVFLQEVSTKDWGLVQEKLGENGFEHATFSGTRAGKKHGVVIASPHRVHARDGLSGRWWEAAEIETPTGTVLGFSAHIPNWRGNGWNKVIALEGLAEAIAGSTGALILAGDFNEPKGFGPAGRVESFGRRGAKSWESRRTDKRGDTDDLMRWRRAVERVFAPEGLRLTHAYLTRHPDECPVTHEVRGGKPRFFDHVLVRDLRAVDAGYDHLARTNGPSDHSLGWAELAAG